MLEEIPESKYYRHTELTTLIQMYKHVSRMSWQINGINYAPYANTIERKMLELGFERDDILAIDTEVWEKVSRDGESNAPRQAKVRRSAEDIFYPFSLSEMRHLITQLWKSQIDSTSKTYKKGIADVRLGLMKESIRKTIIAFFGKSIQKDQAIWIGQEIHKLYLKSTASLK